MNIDSKKTSSNSFKVITLVVIAIIVIITAIAFIHPWYKVWSQEMENKAELAKTEQNINKAKANLEIEKLNAQAEIEKAKGAATAISLEKENITPSYIQYLWVKELGKGRNKTIIYIPTETNLPILESTRNTEFKIGNDDF